MLVKLGASSTKDDSAYGKILFFDIKTKKFKVFSKGHRNPQGLIIDGKNIISTEHGPYGGDEINKILKGKLWISRGPYGNSMNLKIIMRRI